MAISEIVRGHRVSNMTYCIQTVHIVVVIAAHFVDISPNYPNIEVIKGYFKSSSLYNHNFLMKHSTCLSTHTNIL